MLGSKNNALVVAIFSLFSGSPLLVAAEEGTKVLGGELAAFETAPFAPNVLHRQNFCERYRDVVDSQGELTWKDALSGVQLNVVLQYGDSFPYFNYNETKGIDPENPGLAAEFLDYIAERANFTWRDSFGVYRAEDKGENKTWTQMLKWATDTYDISVDKWAQSTERLNMGISYVEPWFDASLIMVDRIEPIDDGKNNVNYFNWVRPFDYQVWIVVIATILWSTGIYIFLESLAGERDGRSSREWIGDNLYLSFINFTQNYSYEPTTPASRVFGVSFAMWSMLIGATYTANLASLLVERPAQPTKISTVDEGIARDMSFCTFENSFSDNYFQRNYGNAKIVPKPSPEAMYRSVNKGKCDVLIGSMQGWLGFQDIDEYNPNCDLEWVGRVVETVNAGFTTKVDPGVRCTGLVNEVFNYFLSEMKDSDFFDERWNAFRSSQATPGKNCAANSDGDDEGRRLFEEEDNEATTVVSRRLKANPAPAAASGADSGEDGNEDDSLTLKQMAGTFMLHAAGSIVAMVVGVYSLYKKTQAASQDQSTSPKGSSNKESSTAAGSLSMSDDVSSASVQVQLDMLHASHRELSNQMQSIMFLLEKIHDRVDGDTDTDFMSCKDEPQENGKVKRFFFG